MSMASAFSPPCGAIAMAITVLDLCGNTVRPQFASQLAVSGVASFMSLFFLRLLRDCLLWGLGALPLFDSHAIYLFVYWLVLA